MNNIDNQEDKSIALLDAAGDGDIARIESLLDEGVDINSRGSNRDTALIVAAVLGNLEVVEYLLAHGADADLQNNTYWTALMNASLEGCFEEVRCLVEHGANMNLLDTNGDTALTVAEGQGEFEISEYLIKAGAQRLDVEAWRDKIKQNSIAFLEAAKSGDILKVKALLSDGVDIDITDTHPGKFTALMIASANGCREIVELLVEYGADVDAINHEQETALVLAEKNGHLKVVEFLVEHGTDVDEINYKQVPTCLALVKMKNGIETPVTNFLINKMGIEGQNQLRKLIQSIDLINNINTPFKYSQLLETVRCFIETGVRFDNKSLGGKKEEHPVREGYYHVINLFEKVAAYRNGISTLTGAMVQRFANGLAGNPYYKDYAEGYNNLSVYIPEELKERILDAIPDRHSQKLVCNPSMSMLNSWVEEIKEERSKLQLGI